MVRLRANPAEAGLHTGKAHPLANDPKTAPKQEIGDAPCIQHPAANGRIARPVTQQRGRHRNDVDSVQLHRKYRGTVADMAVGNLGLDGDDGHGGDRSPDGA